MARHSKIFLGLVAGALAGVICNRFFPDAAILGALQHWLSDPLGTIFVNLLIMMVIPLVFASLSLGVAQLGDLRRLGGIGARTLLIFVVATTAAAGLGLALVNAMRPGDYVAEDTKAELLAGYGQRAAELRTAAESSEFGIDILVNLVPRNPFAAIARPNPDMLALIFVSLIVGIALTRISPSRAAPLLRVLESVNDVTVAIIDLAMKLAPTAVAALVFSVTSRFGFDLLAALAMYVVTVMAGLLLIQFGGYALVVRLLAGRDPRVFFRDIRTVMLTAVSTSSSNATLPTTIAVSRERLGIPASITGFVLPLGATMNMHGTAVFEGITIVFLAQAFGIELSLAAQGIVMVMCVLTAVGAGGVPSGAIPLMIIILGMVNVPAEGIALILGVDRILDMARTVVNVTGDIAAAAVVTRWEGGSGAESDR